MTWFTVEDTGYIASGTGSATIYGVAMNNAITPFAGTGGGNALPNSIGTESTQWPTALRQFLYDGTHTGLYFFARVWAVRYTVNIQPQSTSDNCIVVCAPMSGNDVYANVALAGQAPQSRVVTVTATGPPKQNTIHSAYYMPSLMGISKKEYGASTANTQFSNSAAPSLPWFHQIYVTTQSQAATAGKIAWTVTARYFIELFDRNDSLLSD